MVITFRLEDKEAYALQRLSNHTGKPKTYFIKAGLQLYLKHFFDKEADARTLAALRKSMGELANFESLLNISEASNYNC